jgi:hypothetical protein
MHSEADKGISPNSPCPTSVGYCGAATTTQLAPSIDDPLNQLPWSLTAKVEPLDVLCVREGSGQAFLRELSVLSVRVPSLASRLFAIHIISQKRRRRHVELLGRANVSEPTSVRRMLMSSVTVTSPSCSTAAR